MKVLTLLLVGVLATAALAVGALDPLDRALRAFGDGAVDCGRVGADGSGRDTVNRCVRENFVNARPFFARYDGSGIDSDIASGLVLEKPGRVWLIGYDSIGCTLANQGPWCGTSAHECRAARLIERGKGGLKLVCKDEYEF